MPSEGTNLVTEREGEVLRLVAKGLQNLEVARVLGVSRHTVRTHLEHVYLKLEVTNRVEAIVEGMRKGIVEIPAVDVLPPARAIAGGR